MSPEARTGSRRGLASGHAPGTPGMLVWTTCPACRLDFEVLLPMQPCPRCDLLVAGPRVVTRAATAAPGGLTEALRAWPENRVLLARWARILSVLAFVLEAVSALVAYRSVHVLAALRRDWVPAPAPHDAVLYGPGIQRQLLLLAVLMLGGALLRPRLRASLPPGAEGLKGLAQLLRAVGRELWGNEGVFGRLLLVTACTALAGWCTLVSTTRALHAGISLWLSVTELALGLLSTCAYALAVLRLGRPGPSRGSAA